jgi:hypothetical protein
MAVEPRRRNAENCISDDLDAVLARLTLDQIRFVVARQECATDREAARMVGVSESTVYRWPDDVKEACRLMAGDGVTTALHLRRRSLAKAMAVKAKGLDSDDEKIRQGVATEIIEWELGKATQRNQNDNSGTLEIALRWDEGKGNATPAP